MPAVTVICMPLYLASLWSYELEEFISRRVFIFAVIFSLTTAQITSLVSFWPIVPINGALVVVTVMYVLLGLGQFVFGEKLKQRVIWEHLIVSGIVIFIVLLSTRWSG